MKKLEFLEKINNIDPELLEDRPAVRNVGRHAEAHLRIPSDHARGGSFRRIRNAAGNAEITPVDRMVRQLLRDRAVRAVVLAYHKKTARILVDSMNNSGSNFTINSG